MTDQTKRRDGARLDLQLRVRYSQESGDVSGEGEATDVSARGARLECREPLKEGSRLSFELDAGDGKSVRGVATVTWCRARATPTGKTVYDAGVRFDEDWLKGDRGPLGRALGRFFAATDNEPARDYARVRTQLVAQGRAADQTVPLTVIDLSEGGLRVVMDGGELPAGITAGAAMRVTFGERKHTRVDATVAWVAAGGGGEARLNAQFGVSFRKDDEAARDAVLAILSHLGKQGAEIPPILLELA